MNFSEVLQLRFDRCVELLDLDDAATRLLHSLVLFDVEPEAQARDAYGRQGVLAFDDMMERLLEAGHGADETDAALEVLAGWHLVQIVGREATDPVVAGPAAIRLTPHGRACVGLAPMEPGSRRAATADRGGWLVLHGQSREGLLLSAAERVGDAVFRPLGRGLDKVAWACGEIAVRLCAHGVCVVDGFSVAESERSRVLPELVWRTRVARAPRVLILPQPEPLRTVALAAQVDLLWVEPTGADSSTGLDLGVSERLLSRYGTRMADVAGVPGTNIALPRKVNTRWDDLIVPERVHMQLQQILKHAHFRLHVLPERHAFVGRGTGYRLLLSGLPGTGKSMAAGALAYSLERSLVRLDLSAVLSKWLGETEQLIGRIFDMAEASGAVLVLDEAEALFRQRQSGSSGSSALSTAVAFLLTRLERYAGVLVATTNRTQDLDDAFFRRFDDYLIMPMPDPPTRRVLWSLMLACGLDSLDEHDLDLDLLCERFVVSGGMIRGAAIRANAWAGGQGLLTMPIVLAALARELEKNDQSNREVFVAPYGDEVARLLMDDAHLPH